jgi:hypothetical protein
LFERLDLAFANTNTNSLLFKSTLTLTDTQFLKGGLLSRCLWTQSTSSQPYVNWLNSASTSIKEQSKIPHNSIRIPWKPEPGPLQPLFAHNTHKNDYITCCQISKASPSQLSPPSPPRAVSQAKWGEP